MACRGTSRSVAIHPYEQLRIDAIAQTMVWTDTMVHALIAARPSCNTFSMMRHLKATLNDTVDRAVLGMPASEFKAQHGIPDDVSIPAVCTHASLEVIATVQHTFETLISAAMSGVAHAPDDEFDQWLAVVGKHMCAIIKSCELTGIEMVAANDAHAAQREITRMRRTGAFI